MTDSVPTSSSLTGRIGASILRTRWLVRTPIHVYRLHLGFLFGQRLLMLEHRGRVPGQRRYVVLEVVDHPSPDVYVVAAGFGERANWVKNIEANPAVRVWAGRRTAMPAIASRLAGQEAAAALRRYADLHPQAWQQLRPVFEETLGASISKTGTDLPLFSLRLGASADAQSPQPDGPGTATLDPSAASSADRSQGPMH